MPCPTGRPGATSRDVRDCVRLCRHRLPRHYAAAPGRVRPRRQCQLEERSVVPCSLRHRRRRACSGRADARAGAPHRALLYGGRLDGIWTAFGEGITSAIEALPALSAGLILGLVIVTLALGSLTWVAVRRAQDGLGGRLLGLADQFGRASRRCCAAASAAPCCSPPR